MDDSYSLFVLDYDVVMEILKYVSSRDTMTLSRVSTLLRDLTSEERNRVSKLVPELEYELHFYIHDNGPTKTISVKLDRVKDDEPPQHTLERLSNDDHYYSICTKLLEKLRAGLGSSIFTEYKCKPENVHAGAGLSFIENTDETLQKFIKIIYSFISETISPFESLFKIYSFSERNKNGSKRVIFKIAVNNKKDIFGYKFVQEELSEDTIKKYLNFQSSEFFDPFLQFLDLGSLSLGQG